MLDTPDNAGEGGATGSARLDRHLLLTQDFKVELAEQREALLALETSVESPAPKRTKNVASTETLRARVSLEPLKISDQGGDTTHTEPSLQQPKESDFVTNSRLFATTAGPGKAVEPQLPEPGRSWHSAAEDSGYSVQLPQEFGLPSACLSSPRGSAHTEGEPNGASTRIRTVTRARPGTSQEAVLYKRVALVTTADLQLQGLQSTVSALQDDQLIMKLAEFERLLKSISTQISDPPTPTSNAPRQTLPEPPRRTLPARPSDEAPVLFAPPLVQTDSSSANGQSSGQHAHQGAQ